MALRSITISAAGVATEVANTIATAVAAAKTANQAAGAKADVQTEIDAITAVVPTGAVVVLLDTSLVTTGNQLRKLLDAAFAQIVTGSNLLPPA